MYKFTVFMVVFIAFSCSDSGTSPKYDPPADHTINLDGAKHLPQFDDPYNNCFKCHGIDLMGTNQTPSCYECHDKKW